MFELYGQVIGKHQDLAVARHMEDVMIVMNQIWHRTACAKSIALRPEYYPIFERIDPNAPGQQRLTDGYLRLGRRYLTWTPNVQNSTRYSAVDIENIIKPEHLFLDRKLFQNRNVKHPAWYVQNTYTYYN